MSQVSGTTWTNSVAGSLTMATNVRESLEDVIYLLDPSDTWALSNLERSDSSSFYHEWLSDNLAAAAANRAIEGDDASFSTAIPAQRLGNYHQIVKKTYLVSGSLEAVKKAGRKSELARLGTKLMKEMKRDMEFAIVGDQASSAGGSGTARSSAGMESWIATNVVRATTTASGTDTGFSGGTVASATVGATTGTLTEASLKSLLASCWSAGGDPRVILASPKAKNAIDQFTGVATRFIDSSPQKQAAIVGAANMYVSGYGSPHAVVLSRYVRNGTGLAIALDPDYWAISFLRQPFTEPLAKTGDGEKRQMVAEFTLVSRNEKSSGKLTGIA